MNPKFHHYAVLIAFSSLVVIAIGAYITSQATGRQPLSPGILDGVVHKYVALTAGILALGFAYWQSLDREVPLLVWLALGVFALVAGLGWIGAALFHATLAPVAFTILVAVALVTSSSWNQAPELVTDRAAPALRLFAGITPLLILLQIMLGAGYRHKIIGLLPHLGGALIVTLAILVLAMLIRERHPGHKKLCAAAVWLMSILGTQVMLGFAALLVPMLTHSPIAAIAGTAAHVVVGSLTLAANLVLVMLVHRSIWLAPPGPPKTR